MPKVSQREIERTMFYNVDRDNSRLVTDEHAVYERISAMLPHDVIRHNSEYVRGEINTQSIESFWAILKRGLVGTYHHVDAGYLAQYVAEYEFRHHPPHKRPAAVQRPSGERFGAAGLVCREERGGAFVGSFGIEPASTRR